MDVEQSVRNQLIGYQREYRAPSISVALLRDGTAVWSDAVGHLTGRPDSPVATASTPYRIGSITKTFVAVAVMQLVRDGLASLDDRITDHLSDIDPELSVVTLGSLLNHSSGLYAETIGAWWERSDGLTWEQLKPSIRRAHRVGARFHYSNVGFAVAGEIIARQRNSSWFEAVRSGVLEPLGLSHTTYDRPENAAPGLAVHPHSDLLHAEPYYDTRAMSAAGQLWSTVNDLAVFGRFLVRGNSQVLPHDLREAMLVPSVVDDAPGGPWVRAYGLGTDVYNFDGRRYVGHGGSMPGYLAALLVDPSTGDGYAIQANTTGNFDPTIGDDLLATYNEMTPTQQDVWTASSNPADALTGSWFWGPREYVLTTTNGEIELRPARSGRGSRFIPRADGGWVGTDQYYAGEVLSFHTSSDGSVYLDLGSFRFSRVPYDPQADLPGGADAAGWH